MSAGWRIVAVHDPDGTGSDFAYTVGLHDEGLPELFLWARPTDGDDAADDWKLSNLDLGHELDHLASQLLDGTIAPGSSIESAYDGGATRATLELQPPVPAHGGGLDAFQTDPRATVSEIRWSLHRQPAGPRRELDSEEAAAARDRLGMLVGAEPASGTAFPVDADFGPLSPVLEALRTRTRTIDPNRADHLIAAVHLNYRPESDLGCIQASARAVGLHREVVQAIDLAHADAHEVVERVYHDDPDFGRSATNLFTAVFAAAYGTEIAHHAVPDDARGASEVLWALLDPDRHWTRRFVRAASQADERLADVIRHADTDALAATVADVDDETLGSLVGRWPLAAAAGHGSGLWLVAFLVRSLAGLDAAWRAGAALATAGYEALDIAVPVELGDDVAALARRVAADVRATSLRKAG